MGAADQEKNKKDLIVFFRLGKLRIGIHGLLGCASLIATQIAIRPFVRVPISLITCQVLNALTVHQAKALLHQVPASSSILGSWIVAPHKEAFIRTIAILQYLIVRVVSLWLVTEAYFTHARFIRLALSVWRYGPLVPWPKTTAWVNGNTWIFVVPMWLGVTADLYVQYTLDCFTIEQYLVIQRLGLLLAFGFTLGFRRYMPMPLVYGMASLGVWDIIRQGIQAFNNMQE